MMFAQTVHRNPAVHVLKASRQIEALSHWGWIRGAAMF